MDNFFGEELQGPGKTKIFGWTYAILLEYVWLIRDAFFFLLISLVRNNANIHQHDHEHDNND